MKPETQEKVDQIVDSIHLKWQINQGDVHSEKLKAQIRKIVKNLVKKVRQIEKKKILKETKLLEQEMKRQSRQNRILAARQLISGQFLFVKTE